MPLLVSSHQANSLGLRMSATEACHVRGTVCDGSGGVDHERGGLGRGGQDRLAIPRRSSGPSLVGENPDRSQGAPRPAAGWISGRRRPPPRRRSRPAARSRRGGGSSVRRFCAAIRTVTPTCDLAPAGLRRRGPGGAGEGADVGADRLRQRPALGVGRRTGSTVDIARKPAPEMLGSGKRNAPPAAGPARGRATSPPGARRTRRRTSGSATRAVEKPVGRTQPSGAMRSSPPVCAAVSAQPITRSGRRARPPRRAAAR